jgi:hypothetical protein
MSASLQNIPTNSGIGYMDFLMNQMIIDQLKSINKPDGFTFTTISTLLFILSVSELNQLLLIG